MAENNVRRLVGVNEQNQVEDVLSTDDVVLYAETTTTGKADLPSDDFLSTVKTLHSPELSARAAVAAG